MADTLPLPAFAPAVPPPAASSPAASSPAAAAFPHRYDGVTIALHWASAGLIGLVWVLGQTRFFWPAGAPRSAVISLHILIGLAILAMLAARITWRLGRGRRLPPVGHGLAAAGARAGHLALYGLMGLTLLAGLAGVLGHGFTLFGTHLLPPLTLAGSAILKFAGGWHGVFANLLVLLAAGHAGTALYHRIVLRDATLARMLPRSFAGRESSPCSVYDV